MGWEDKTGERVNCDREQLRMPRALSYGSHSPQKCGDVYANRPNPAVKERSTYSNVLVRIDDVKRRGGGDGMRRQNS